MNGKPVKEIPMVPRREAKKPKVDHDDHDDCFCEQPISEDEATSDEELPPASGGVEHA
jgi:hypothetical protein